MNIQHSSGTDLWYTPLPIILAVHEVLGRVDLDPASDEFGNARIQAKYYITAEVDALASPWMPNCSVFLNPPGGKTGNQSNTALFWKRLMEYRNAGQLTHAIFLAFSLEAMQNTQDKGVDSIAAFPFCIPSKRLRFDSRDGVYSAPSHANVIVYVPGTIDRSQAFVSEFSKFGLSRI